ncbi:hypothetical protein GCM10018954_047390 [Kutzneria kofuensis]
MRSTPLVSGPSVHQFGTAVPSGAASKLAFGMYIIQPSQLAGGVEALLADAVAPPASSALTAATTAQPRNVPENLMVTPCCHV